jgi:hypothetical protein
MSAAGEPNVQGNETFTRRANWFLCTGRGTQEVFGFGNIGSTTARVKQVAVRVSPRHRDIVNGLGGEHEGSWWWRG